MKKTTPETKTNRYTVLGTEIKRLSAELKAKKQEMVTAIRKLEAEYRDFRKNVYAPARKAAYETFKASKVNVGKKTEAKVVKAATEVEA